MKFLKIFITCLVSACFIFLIFSGYFLFYPLYQLNNGASYSKIISNIKNTFSLSLWQSKILDVYIRLRHYDQKIKTGDFTSILQKKDIFSLKELVDILVFTQLDKTEQKITFIEGFTNAEMGQYLKETLNLEDFESIIEKNIDLKQEKYAFLKEPNRLNSLQGYLFPDTYFVYKDISSTEILDKLLTNFQNKISDQILADLRKQNRTLHEAVILASILEKEVRTLETKQMVADIFLKRLEKGQLLQSDATINFITKKGTDRPSFEDLNTESLYNTYKYAGLPPGPICNPGLDSIIAAVYPTANDYYYFLTTQDGKIYYAKTYQEHLQNKNNYLK